MGGAGAPPRTLRVRASPATPFGERLALASRGEKKKRPMLLSSLRLRSCEGVRRTAWRGRLAAKQRGGTLVPHEIVASAVGGEAVEGRRLVP